MQRKKLNGAVKSFYFSILNNIFPSSLARSLLSRELNIRNNTSDDERNDFPMKILLKNVSPSYEFEFFAFNKSAQTYMYVKLMHDVSMCVQGRKEKV